MIRAKTCFVAEGLTTDRDTGQISAFGLLENLQAESYPLSVQKIAFFCLWQRAAADPAVCRAEFSVTLDGQDIARQSVNVNFQQYLHNRCTIRLDGFMLGKPGNIVFRLAIPGHETAEWTIEAGVGAPTAPGAGPFGPVSSGSDYKFNPVSISIGSVNLRGR